MRFTVYSFVLLAVVLLAVYFLVRRKWLPGALLAAAVLIWFLSGGNVANQVTVEAGTQSVEADAFVRTGFAGSASFVSDLSTVDLNQPGDYPVQVHSGILTHDCVLQVRDTISPTATPVDIFTAHEFMPEAGAFISDIQDVTAVTVQYAALPDMTVEGDQTVELILTDTSGNTTSLQAKLTVCFDQQAPEIQVTQPLQTYSGITPDYLQFATVTDDRDASPTLTVDDNQVNIDLPGCYNVFYSSTDSSGNQAVLVVPITVIEDTTAPTIFGVQTISLFAGSTVSYRSGIALEDDTDPNPQLTVDASGVDLSQPGKYTVTYTATDAAGNKAQVSTEVVVSKTPNNYVDEETICAMADAILAQILTEGMTNQQKVEAIYKWIDSNCIYNSLPYVYTDKTDWMQSAYHMLDKHYGSCFGYYATSKLFFERLGLPNMMVQRAFNIYRSDNHYWNLVSLDDGKTWYHFDTTDSIAETSRDRCLLTDAQLDYFSEHYVAYYYYRDRSLTPATPEEPLVDFS